MFILFCFMIFASQFKYILSFGFGGISFTPVRVCFLILILVDLFTSKGKLQVKKKNNIWLWAMLIWNIWSLISFLWAKDKSGLFGTEIVLFEALGFIYYAQKLITTPERAKSALNVLLAACVIHNLLGWLEITAKIYLFSRYTEKYSKLGYPVSTFTNTNNFGFYLALMAVVLTGIIFVSKNRNYRIIAAVLLTSSLFLLFKTGSRGAIIDVMIGAVLFALLLRKNLKFTLVIGGLTIALLVLLMVYPSVFNSIEQLYQNAFKVDVNASSGSDYYRMHMLANGMDFYGASYGLGVGAGNVEYWMERFGTRFTNNIFNLHNWWIEILVGSGTLVFIVVLFAWIVTYRKLIRRYIAGYRRNLICTLITFGVVFAIGSISPSTLFAAEWPWTLLAMFFFFDENPDLLTFSAVSTAHKKRVVIRFGKRALPI